MKSFNRLNSRLVAAALAGVGLATVAPTGVATASAAGGSQAASGCRIVSELYRDGNTIYSNAETVPCQVPIFLALFRDNVQVERQHGGAAINIMFPCTPVSFDVVWKNSRGDQLITKCF